MCARIRYIYDNNIYVYLNNIPFIDNSFIYTIYEIKNYFLTIYSRFLRRKIVYVDDKPKFEYENDLYNKILMFNLLEEYNKNSAYFITVLLKLLNDKHHTYELDNDVFIDEGVDVGINKSVTQNEIINAENINQNTFDQLIIKQNACKLTHIEKIKMEKFVYMKTFNC